MNTVAMPDGTLLDTCLINCNNISDRIEKLVIYCGGNASYYESFLYNN